MNHTTHAVDVHNISKRYGDILAVDDLSFDVQYGEIFGLLGPNGAGKTSMIRMMLDIIKPTLGKIAVLGGPMTEAKKAHIGYLPEERGLYDDMTVIDTLLFLGQLKELDRTMAAARAEAYLQEVELWDKRDEEIQALSRGMRQKVQFVAATMHEPELIVIDEPFSGLDPVNARLIKGMLLRMRDRGAAIIMSTHQMHEVEALCERMMLIDHGRRVLYGTVAEIRERFAINAVEVEIAGDLGHIPGIAQVSRSNGTQRLLLEEGTQPETILAWLVQDRSVTVKRFERVAPSLDDVFVRVVGRRVAEEATV